jgi:hypothetical protein
MNEQQGLTPLQIAAVVFAMLVMIAVARWLDDGPGLRSIFRKKSDEPTVSG